MSLAATVSLTLCMATAPCIPYGAVAVRSVDKVRMVLVTTTTSQEAPNPSGQGASQPLPARDRQVIAILLVAAFVVILNETIMSVALPRLMVDLGISARTVQWLTTAFMLTMAVVIPTTGFLLQRVSTRTVFMLAMGLFSAGTLLAAVSPGFWVLLLARIVQASGTAVMIPLLMTTVLTLVPAERRGVVMGNITIAISVAPAIGPTLSGLVLQFLSWRFMFVLVLPIALASLVYGSRRLVNVGQPGHQKLDFPSVLLSIPAFGGLVYGLSQLGRGASGPEVAIGFIAFGLVLMLIFGWRQLRLTRSGRSPLLDLRPFSYRMFSLSLALLCLAMLALFGMVILLPIYLQTVRGIGSLATGLMLLPGGLLMGLAGPTVGKIIDRHGPQLLTIPGAILLTFTLWQFSNADASTPIWMLIGRAHAADAGTRLLVHTLIHRRFEPAAAVPLFTRQCPLGHTAAGGGGGWSCAAGGDHGEQNSHLDPSRAAGAGRAERRHSDRLRRRSADQHRGFGVGVLHSQHQAAHR